MTILYIVDIPTTLTGAVAVITIIGAIFKVAQFFYRKMLAAIHESRIENESLTNCIKDQLIEHIDKDDSQFENIRGRFEKNNDILSRIDEKVTLLITNKIK